MRLLKRWNFKFDVMWSQMSAAYKWKTNKMQSVDQIDFSENCSEWVTNWKKWILKKRLESVLQWELNLNLYKYLIMLKFSDIT